MERGCSAIGFDGGEKVKIEERKNWVYKGTRTAQGGWLEGPGC